MRKTFKERYIRPEIINIGDTIRWTEKIQDITISKVGTVHNLDYVDGLTRWRTEEYHELGRHRMGTKFTGTITLLKPAPENQDQPIENFDKLLDIASRNG